jgi:hypothetical protein
VYRFTQVEIFIYLGRCKKVGKDIIEGKIHGQNLPKLFQKTKAFYFKKKKLLYVFGLYLLYARF